MRGVAVAIGTLVSSMCTLGLLLWLVGRVVSDRYLWSQFLLWIPTPIALALALIGLLSALRPARNAARKRRRRICWAICLLTVTAYFGFFEHRMMRLPPAAGEGLQILHWNAWQEDPDTPDDYLAGVLALEPDILILTDVWNFPWSTLSRDWAAQRNGAWRTLKPFSVISRLPLLTARHLVSKDEVIIALFEFDAVEQLGRTLIIYAVDMPSDLTLSRMKLANDARRLLAEIDAPPPDIVVGDFNITRNSAGMRTMFPGMHHAFNDAGYGYGATYHRRFPLYHIDHILLHESLRATRYGTFDPGTSRHRAQAARIKTNSSER